MIHFIVSDVKGRFAFFDAQEKRVQAIDKIGVCTYVQSSDSFATFYFATRQDVRHMARE